MSSRLDMDTFVHEHEAPAQEILGGSYDLIRSFCLAYSFPEDWTRDQIVAALDALRALSNSDEVPVEFAAAGSDYAAQLERTLSERADGES